MNVDELERIKAERDALQEQLKELGVTPVTLAAVEVEQE